MSERKEAGLLVIWPNFIDVADAIVAEVGSRFDLLRTQFINWPTDDIKGHFYRFYGDRLSTSSIREKTSGSGRFLLVVFEDRQSTYTIETTARGIERVNANFFAQKQSFRKSYGTKFGLHASNDEQETERDLALLLGRTLEQVREDHAQSGVAMPEIHRALTGHQHWSSFDEFFAFMNRVEPYVVLRNVDEIAHLSPDDDVDFLVFSRTRFSLFANAEKKSSGAERANYELIVGGKPFRIDIRYVGDGYFDGAWQAQCLKNRVLDQDGRYVLDPENQFYTLAYHCFIHKRKFPKKYTQYFGVAPAELKRRLYQFMLDHGYRMVEPRDVTLNFNVENGGSIKLSRARRLRSRKGLSGAIKRLAYRTRLKLLGQGTPD